MSETGRASGPPIFAWYMGSLGFYFFAMGVQGVLFPWIIAVVLHEPSDRVGIAQMLSMLPMLLLSLFGGALADKVELRGHLFRLQLLSAVLPLVLAALIASGFLSYWVMIGYMLVFSAFGGYIVPARDSMLTRVAEEGLGGNIQRAVAFATSGQFSGQVAGFLLGGTAMIVGAPILLVIQSVVVLFAAFMTRQLPEVEPHTPQAPSTARTNPFREVVEGLKAIWANERIRPVLVFMFFSGILFMGVFMVLFPILIRDYYGGSSFEIALVSMCFFGGVGISSLVMSQLPAVRRQGRLLMLAMCTGSCVMVFIHFGPPSWVVNLLALGWGLAAGVSMSQSRSIVQAAAVGPMRGRILAGFQMGMMGGGPLGSLLIGFVIQWLGVLDAVLVPVVCMAALWVTVFFTTPLWRLEAEGPHVTRSLPEAAD